MSLYVCTKFPLSYIFQVFKMWLTEGEKQAHVIQWVMPSFLTLIFADSEGLSRQRRYKLRSQPIVSKHRGRGHLVLLGPQDIPMRWIFQPVMCRTFSASSKPTDDTCAAPAQDPTSTVRLPWLPFLPHMSCLCQPCPGPSI